MWKLSEYLLDQAGLRPMFIDFAAVRETARETEKSIDLLEDEIAYAALPESIIIPGNVAYFRARQRLSRERKIFESRIRDYRRAVKRIAGAFAPDQSELELLQSDIVTDRLVLARYVRELEYVFLLASGNASIVGRDSPAKGSKRPAGLFRRLADHFLRGVA